TPAPEVGPEQAADTTELDLAFRRSWLLDRHQATWGANRWCGIWCLQTPVDLWTIQEIIAETRPDTIGECGSFLGASALAWAMILEQVTPTGRVIAVDVEDRFDLARALPAAERVEWVIGSTTADDVVARVRSLVQGRTMVLLDSDHSCEHVSAELAAYGDLPS